MLKPQKGCDTDYKPQKEPNINPAQIAKMQQARKLAKTTRKPVSLSNLTDLQRKDIQRVSNYLPTVLKTFQLAYEHKSMAKAVKAKCLECCNLEKVHIPNCPIEGCPLWRYRPYQKKSA